MARSWEYSRQRRIAMQLAMWAIFGLTLVLAGVVSHHKRQDLKIPLGPPVRVGELTVRLPEGWRYSVFRSDDVLVVRAKEPGDENHRAARVVQVTQERLTDAAINAEGYLSNNILNSDLHLVPMSFTGLKSDGVSADIADQDEDSSSQAAPPGAYAATICPVPDGHRLAVVASVEDLAPFTTADHDALRQIADAITLAK